MSKFICSAMYWKEGESIAKRIAEMKTGVNTCICTTHGEIHTLLQSSVNHTGEVKLKKYPGALCMSMPLPQGGYAIVLAIESK
jgi:hypothetical protein